MESRVQKLYRKQANFYELLFMRWLRYHLGVRSFFERTDYLRDGQRILDAGCGTGTVVKALMAVAQKKGIHQLHFYGFDLTPAMLQRFQGWIDANRAKNIELQSADALRTENLPADWQNFDLIVSSAMLEYLPKGKLSHALKDLRARLRPGGRIIIFITRDNLITQWLIGRWWKANTYQREELEEAFTAAGFGPLTFKKFPDPYNYLNSWGFIVEAGS